MDESKMDKCGHIKDSFDAYLSGGLSPSDKERIEEHLASCESCRRALENEKRIIALLGSMEPASAPEALRQNVMRRLREEPSATPSFFRRLAEVFTLPRLRILSGVAALAILVFIFFHSPPRRDVRTSGALEKQQDVAASRNRGRHRKSSGFGEKVYQSSQEERVPRSTDEEYLRPTNYHNRLKRLGATNVSMIPPIGKAGKVRYAFLIPAERLESLIEEIKGEQVQVVKVETRAREKKKEEETPMHLDYPRSLKHETTGKELRDGQEIRSSTMESPDASPAPMERVEVNETQRLGRSRPVRFFGSAPDKDFVSPSGPTPSPSETQNALIRGLAPGDQKQPKSPSLDDYHDHQNLLYVEIEVTRPK